MKKSVWYLIVFVCSVMLGILFYLSYKYYQLHFLSPSFNDQKRVVIKGSISCLDDDCSRGFLAQDGTEYFLSIQKVKDPGDLINDFSRQIEITGTVNTKLLLDDKYPILTVDKYEKI